MSRCLDGKESGLAGFIQFLCFVDDVPVTSLESQVFQSEFVFKELMQFVGSDAVRNDRPARVVVRCQCCRESYYLIACDRLSSRANRC